MRTLQELIGNTPLVKLNKVNESEALVLTRLKHLIRDTQLKIEMALKMIKDAEKKGLLKPNGTIIEGTGGNTGMGLAGSYSKRLQMYFVLADKQSKEKMDILRAVDEVGEVCPTNVEPEDPRSYYSVSKRLAKEIPNSWYVNQYDNPSNAKAHYETTGQKYGTKLKAKLLI